MLHKELEDLNLLEKREKALLERVEAAPFKRGERIPEAAKDYSRAASFEPSKHILSDVDTLAMSNLAQSFVDEIDSIETISRLEG